jgi:succinyl-CoA synthetase alpha subunit
MNKSVPSPSIGQRRSLYIKQHQALDILRENGLEVSEQKTSPGDFTLSISIDRTALAPCIAVSPDAEPKWTGDSFRRVPFNYMKPEFERDASFLSEIASYLGLPATSNDKLQGVIQKLWHIFTSKEAFILQTRLSMASSGTVVVRGARFGFDDAAFKTSRRQSDIHALREKSEEVPEEVEAEKDGIIYVK